MKRFGWDDLIYLGLVVGIVLCYVYIWWNSKKTCEALEIEPEKPLPEDEIETNSTPVDGFQEVVDDVVSTLPPEILNKMTDVAVVAAFEPNPEEQKIAPGKILLGYYSGSQVFGRTFDSIDRRPKVIKIFMKNVTAVSPTVEELRERIRTVVLHEVGHYLGADHKVLGKMGL